MYRSMSSFRGPGETVIEPHELLVSLHIETPPPWTGGAYIKLGARKTLEISMVNVATLLTLAITGRADCECTDCSRRSGAHAGPGVRG